MCLAISLTFFTCSHKFKSRAKSKNIEIANRQTVVAEVKRMLAALDAEREQRRIAVIAEHGRRAAELEREIRQLRQRQIDVAAANALYEKLYLHNIFVKLVLGSFHRVFDSSSFSRINQGVKTSGGRTGSSSPCV